EGALVVGHEAEVGLEPRRHLLAGTTRGRGGLLHLLEQALTDVVEQLQVELTLRPEVLVQHGFGDTRGLGHLRHRRAVEALLGEHLEGHVEELAATADGGEAGLGHGYPRVTRWRGRYHCPAWRTNCACDRDVELQTRVPVVRPNPFVRVCPECPWSV